MKKIIVLAFAALAATGAWAQGTFTIRRPLDGAKVREVVKVRIPKNSIPEHGYVGVYINGKFLEATLPDIEGEDYVYNLDTQGRKLEDGPAKIELVLFVDVNEKPQIVNRSSVNVVIDNVKSITVPEGGFKLRYTYTPGTERVYTLSVNQEAGMVSQAQAQLGSRAPMIQAEDQKVRLLYAIDNAYSTKTGREGLMRIQLIPDKGKDYATIIPTGETKPRKITKEQMEPLYLRLTDVGREVFGSVPIYFGLDGSNGSVSAERWFPILPFPVLPTKAVKPGDNWQAAHLFGALEDNDKLAYQSSFTNAFPARGTFEGVSWYKGMRCAKFTTVISEGPELLKNVKNLNQVKGQASNIKLEGNYWFSLDKGVIVRFEENITQESMIDVGTAGSGGGGNGMGGSEGSSRKGGPVGSEGGPSAGGSVITEPTGFNFVYAPGKDQFGNAWIFQNRGKGGGIGAGPGSQMGGDEAQGRGGPQGGSGRGGRFGQRGGGGGGPRKMVMRVRISYVAELEK